MPISTIELGAVLRTDDLLVRVQRKPDYASENRALVALAQALASNPRAILDTLVQSALQLCGAGSTGISILDSETGGDPNQFRWRALAGAWKDKYLGATLPRNHSPCGVVLSLNSTQLMTEPAKYYEYVSAVKPECLEVLLVPFHVGAEPVGTIWAVMHEPDAHFDAEDERLLSSLAKFASAGYQALRAIEALEADGAARTTEVKALSDADKMKDEFIATIAHELRNPLSPIRNSVPLLMRQPGDRRSVERVAQLIDRASAKIARLIDDLLDVSRVRLGVLELHRSRVKLADVVRAALTESQLSAPGSSHVVQTDIGENDVDVEGDYLRLTQVFVNLLNNAAKYTNANGHISIRLVATATQASVHISDTGIGISKEKIDSIFELFAQAGQAGSARSRGGLGIGLHLARQLVEAHDGKLRASSEGVGRGSVFTVELPRV